LTSGLQPLAGAGGLQATFDRAWNRPTAKDWADVLARLPLFSRVSKRHLRKVAGLAELAEFAGGDIVIQAGEPGDAFYLIVSGRAKVLGKSRGLRAGDYFGEMALLDGEPRSTTVAAASELQTMKLRRRPFLKLLEQEPRIAIAMLAELSGRVRRLEKRPAA
jgi:CRP/FNR family cyclic AMP-dependent transcriptional regulator